MALLGSVSFAQMNNGFLKSDCLSIPEKAYPNGTDETLIETSLNCEVEGFKLVIYDNFESVVFETNDVSVHWDVTKVPTGKYTWEFSGYLPNTIPRHTIKDEGVITIVRN